MPDDNFDWIAFRKACGPQETFNRLRVQVKHDVEVRNADLNSTIPPKAPLRYAEVNGSFEVSRDQRSVTFKCGSNKVIITGSVSEIPCVLVRLNADGKCEVVDHHGNLIKLWRIVYLALDSLFFTDKDQ